MGLEIRSCKRGIWFNEDEVCPDCGARLPPALTARASLNQQLIIILLKALNMRFRACVSWPCLRANDADWPKLIRVTPCKK